MLTFSIFLLVVISISKSVLESIPVVNERVELDLLKLPDMEIALPAPGVVTHSSSPGTVSVVCCHWATESL